jgi:hypothetical protein
MQPGGVPPRPGLAGEYNQVDAEAKHFVDLEYRAAKKAGLDNVGIMTTPRPDTAAEKEVEAEENSLVWAGIWAGVIAGACALSYHNHRQGQAQKELALAAARQLGLSVPDFYVAGPTQPLGDSAPSLAVPPAAASAPQHHVVR